MLVETRSKMAIQANLGYYVASELRFVTPGLLRVAVCTGAAVPLRIGKHLSILEHQ
jgi:hypothetical protein